jgi:hypothetical protein
MSRRTPPNASLALVEIALTCLHAAHPQLLARTGISQRTAT